MVNSFTVSLLISASVILPLTIWLSSFTALVVFSHCQCGFYIKLFLDQSPYSSSLRSYLVYGAAL
jgi:hypothetical protein